MWGVRAGKTEVPPRPGAAGLDLLGFPSHSRGQAFRPGREEPEQDAGDKPSTVASSPQASPDPSEERTPRLPWGPRRAPPTWLLFGILARSGDGWRVLTCYGVRRASLLADRRLGSLHMVAERERRGRPHHGPLQLLCTGNAHERGS